MRGVQGHSAIRELELHCGQLPRDAVDTSDLLNCSQRQFRYGSRTPVHNTCPRDHTTAMDDSVEGAGSRATVTPARADAEQDVQRAIAIGDLNRNRLGLLPRKAYAELAQRGTLLLAKREDQIVGYAAYELTKKHVRLVHLCVDTDFRRQGIASDMVRYISDHHSDYPGIKATCRRSYKLGPMWIGLGFTPRSEKKGRSGELLINYWLDHGHPNLLTSDEFLVRAAIDFKVLRGLADAGSQDSRDAQAMLEDEFSDRLALVRTGALDREINKVEDSQLRQRCLASVSSMERVNPSAHQPDEVRREVLKLVAVDNPAYPATAQDEFDLAHVVDAVAAGVNVLATSDQDLARTLGLAAGQLYGLRIMSPADVIIHLDELAHAEAYRPAELLGTDYRLQQLGVRETAISDRFVDLHGGERPRSFQELLKELAGQGADRTCIIDPTGEQVAIYCTLQRKDVLEAPLLRIASHTLASTLARQILFQLRKTAAELGASVARITDSHIGPDVTFAAVADGFKRRDGAFIAAVIDVVGSANDVNAAALRAARTAGLPKPDLLRSTMPVAVAAEIERIWWPAKLVDSTLPTYVVPIQQGFSRDLLGTPTTINARPALLGLSRDHVYYRSVQGRMQTPARLLWYMSQTGRSVQQGAAIVACSQLELVVEGTPEELHRRFQHLGVWTEDRIRTVAGSKGVAQALCFTNTEPFVHAVGVNTLRRIAAAYDRQWQAPPTFRSIPSPEQFADIYRAGRGL